VEVELPICYSRIPSSVRTARGRPISPTAYRPPPASPRRVGFGPSFYLWPQPALSIDSQNPAARAGPSQRAAAPTSPFPPSCPKLRCRAMDRSKTDSGWPTRLWLPLLLVALPAAAYSNALVGPFVLDDLPSIRDNLSLRAWPTALVTPLTSTTHGRPFLNLSFALNYHLSGDSVGSYHLVNLTIHILAGLVLFGVLRRTLRPFAGTAAATVAFFGARCSGRAAPSGHRGCHLCRAASGVPHGLFYLGTLYCFIRYVDPGDGASPARAPRRWAMLCIVSCGLGMATKEVMVSAPLVFCCMIAPLSRAAFGNHSGATGACC